MVDLSFYDLLIRIEQKEDEMEAKRFKWQTTQNNTKDWTWVQIIGFRLDYFMMIHLDQIMYHSLSSYNRGFP